MDDPAVMRTRSELDGLDPALRRSIDGLERRLSARPQQRVQIDGFRHAAVLLPLVVRGEHLALTLIRRSEDGGIHSGQIAFPGGAREPGDADSAATAVREAAEEVGIPSTAVRVLGLLDDTATISHFVVTPVVGLVSAPPDYRLDPEEVQEVFEVPLAFLLDPSSEERTPDAEFLGRVYPMWRYVHEGRIIWGVTARILHDFIDLARRAFHDATLELPDPPG